MSESENFLITASPNNNHQEPKTFMEKLSDIMDDNKFRKFFNDYFEDWSEIQTAIMMMKTYAFIDEEYYKNTGQKMDSKDIINILQEMIKDSNCRKILVEEMNGFMKEKNKFLDYYKNAFPQLLIKNE